MGGLKLKLIGRGEPTKCENIDLTPFPIHPFIGESNEIFAGGGSNRHAYSETIGKRELF